MSHTAIQHPESLHLDVLAAGMIKTVIYLPKHAADSLLSIRLCDKCNVIVICSSSSHTHSGRCW